MLNQVVLVGRLAKAVEWVEEGKKAYITIAVPRPFKNEEGIFETDFVKCELWNAVATNTSEYCQQGDLIGVKGSIRTTKVDDDYEIKIVADKLTFLSSRKSEETSN